MRKVLIGIASLALGMLSYGTAISADFGVIGKSEFRNSCAVCHGIDGKGGTGIVDVLKKAPPNLTLLAKNNGGMFPDKRVSLMIDGREIVKGHGERDMPIWGSRYSQDGVRAGEYYGDLPYTDTKQFVQSRIDALMGYLKSIQVK